MPKFSALIAYAYAGFKTTFTICMLGNFASTFVVCLIFTKSFFFLKILSEVPSDCQTVWIQVSLSILTGLVTSSSKDPKLCAKVMGTLAGRINALFFGAFSGQFTGK